MTRWNPPTRLAPAGALLAALALSAPPAPAAEAPAAPQKAVTVEGITEYRLGNGVRALLYPDPSSAKVTVNMTVFVGSRHEGYGETGMAHLLEHMLFKGTPRHPAIPKALRDRGANFNGTTWVDRTNYYETLPASDDNLEFAVRLEADRLVNSYVKREDLLSEMTVVRNEFEAGENNPQGVLSQRMLAAAYEWHNYGKSTIGNRSDIERVPIENLQAFYRKHYQPDNVLVVIAGKFDEVKALAYLSKYFGALTKPGRKLENTYTEEPPQDGERTVALRRVGTVGVVGAVYHVPAGAHEDFAAVEVLATLLAAQPSGPLYEGLVTAKKASGVSAVAFDWHDPGVLEVFARVDKGAALEGVRDTMLDVLDAVRGGKIDPAAVERAKAELAKERTLQMTRSDAVGISLSDWAAQGDWRLFFLHRDRVARVTPADVARVAARYLVPTNRTVGLYVPTAKPDRAAIPPAPDVAALVKDYKGGKAVAAGEFFDPTPANVEQRVQRPVLSSGVKAALLPKKTRAGAVVLTLNLRYGSAESLKGKASASQFLAPLMARATKKHTRQQLKDELDRLQAVLAPGGEVGQARFTVQCKRENLPRVLELLGEILREPAFPADEFDVLKRQRRDALERGRTEPTALAFRTLQRKLGPYPKDDVRYLPTVEESIERLEAVTLDDVRRLYADQLGGGSGELVVVGDFDPAATAKQVDDALKGWKAATPYRRIERPAVPGVKGERVEIDTPDKENAVWVAALGLPLDDSDPDEPALAVGNYLFGGGPLSSRLADRVRQKEGLSYGVGSQYQSEAVDKSSRFMMYAICNPKNVDKVDRAMLEELDKLRKSGMTEQELAEAKKAYLAMLKNGRADDQFLLAQLLEDLEAGRTFAYHAEMEKKIGVLAPEEVVEAFRKYLDPNKLVIIRAGDFKKK
jgi:zinc protease